MAKLFGKRSAKTSRRSNSRRRRRYNAGRAEEEGQGSGSSEGSLPLAPKPKRKRRRWRRRRRKGGGGRRRPRGGSTNPKLPPSPNPATTTAPAPAGRSQENLLLLPIIFLHGVCPSLRRLPPAPPPPPPRQSRLAGVRGGAGEIVEVQGGHIVRSTGRKDRHSKVCTAKGPRDRRVRLSAHTAIQFYDVQDRLGYDRPSKVVDWLMKNAKSAIDELAPLPAWNPTATMPLPPPFNQPQDDDHFALTDSGKKPMNTAFGFGGGAGSSSNAGFLPPSLDSDAIADTIKSFFPLAAAAAASSTPSSSPPIGYSQDLRLSLHSFQDPIFYHPHSSHNETQNPNASAHHAVFSGSTPFAFDASWPEHGQRMFSWNSAETGDGGGGGYMFNVPPPPPQAVPFLGHGQYFTQRGPLQSSNSPSVRGWVDPMAPSAADHHQMHNLIHPSTIGFTSSGGGCFSGYHIPARIQGEEEHDGVSDKPSSASSASHH